MRKTERSCWKKHFAHDDVFEFTKALATKWSNGYLMHLMQALDMKKAKSTLKDDCSGIDKTEEQ